MTRHELYNKITPCGTLSYTTMVYLLNSISFTDETIRQLLLSRIPQSGSLSQQDWILLSKNVSYLPESTITSATVQEWLTGKCNLTLLELKAFLEGVRFTDGSAPTFILSYNGDFIIAE